MTAEAWQAERLEVISRLQYAMLVNADDPRWYRNHIAQILRRLNAEVVPKLNWDEDHL